ncbi:hypothetical protein ACFW0H_05770 [Pseudomonas sp. CR3202]
MSAALIYCVASLERRLLFRKQHSFPTGVVQLHDRLLPEIEAP